MRNILVRCVSCGNIYEKGAFKDCPACHSVIYDNVLITIPMVENNVVVDFKALMSHYPRVFGLSITGNN